MADRFNVAADLIRARLELELFLLGGAFDLYEDRAFIATVQACDASAEISYGKLILSCWGEGWSRSWRVVDCQPAETGLRLECARQMNRARSILSLERGRGENRGSVTRDEFPAWLARMIESRFTGCRVEPARTPRETAYNFSDLHTRLMMKDRNKTALCLGVASREPQATTDALLGQAIMWLDAHAGSRPFINRLMLFVPSGRALALATRLALVDRVDTEILLYEYDENRESISPVAAFDQGDLSDNLKRAARRALWPKAATLDPDAAALVERIVQLAPAHIETVFREGRVKMMIRGLEFAEVIVQQKRARFASYCEGPGFDRVGLNGAGLNEATWSDLERLVRKITRVRRADSDCRDHEFYRAQAERWLESLLRKDITALDTGLDPRHVYSQVPAYRGEKRAYIDLLAVTREGRLVVIELKVSEDAELPFQGLDYWARVDWHRRRGDFERRGYFKGVRLADLPPLLYLVAPLFRFHAATKLLAATITDRVGVYRVGINGEWRASVRVLLKERLN